MHRQDLGLYSHLKEFWGNGVRTHVNSKGKIPPPPLLHPPTPLPAQNTRKILLRGGSNPQRCIKQDSDHNILPQYQQAILTPRFSFDFCVLDFLEWVVFVFVCLCMCNSLSDTGLLVISRLRVWLCISHSFH